ncbi:MAG: DUF3047 domain-containing protein [Panacagrimonas sp.]
MRLHACCLALCLLAGPASAQKLDLSLRAWTPQPLPKVERQTQWTEGTDQGAPTLDAQSAVAASGLTQKLDWPGATTLRWRWQVSRSVKNGDLAKKSGDDFAARLYVFFDPPDSHLSFGERTKLAIGRKLFGDALPRAALCYVWATREAVGTLAPNAYTDRVRMIVLDSGDTQAGQWRTHARDLAADYTAAFGHAPAPRITGISLMSDTDNTGDTVSARFAGVERVMTGER